MLILIKCDGLRQQQISNNNMQLNKDSKSRPPPHTHRQSQRRAIRNSSFGDNIWRCSEGHSGMAIERTVLGEGEGREMWVGRRKRAFLMPNAINLKYNTKLVLASAMFYFAFPPYLLPNAANWFLPVTEVVQMVGSSEEEQNSNFFKQSISETILVPQFPQECRQGLPVEGTASGPKMSVAKDEDYRPQTYVSKKSKKSQQLENRNVVPNIIRLILSFIQKRGKSSRIVDKIIERSSIGQGWSTKRFYLYQAIIRSQMDNYVNIDTLRQLVQTHPHHHALYSREEQLFYNRITRTLIHYFLNEEITACVLTSKRMDRTKKTHHLAALRHIRHALPLLFSA